jgi:hypothetical protein
LEPTAARPRTKHRSFARIPLEEITNRDNDWLYTERMRVWVWILIKTQHGLVNARFTPPDAYDLGLAHQNRRRQLRYFEKRGRIKLLEIGAREVWIALTGRSITDESSPQE